MPEAEKVAETVEVSNEQDKLKKSETQKKGKDKNVDELSEEDQALKDGLELAVTRLKESNVELHSASLIYMGKEIRAATSSMTSVPKPLKFLRNSYDDLKAVYASWNDDHPNKKDLADILSVLAMTMQKEGDRECLSFKLKGHWEDLSSWGHEYLRSLGGEISKDYAKRVEDSGVDEAEVDDLIALVDVIVPFMLSHNAEADAVDLLIEVDSLHKLSSCESIDARNNERVCLYLLKCGDYLSDPDSIAQLYDTAYFLYKKFHRYVDALRVALKVNNDELVLGLFDADSGATELEKLQMAYVLGRHHSHITIDTGNFEKDNELNEIIGNSGVSERFLRCVTDFNFVKPKTAEDVFKNSQSRRSGSSNADQYDSARGNLAITFVNAFANAGFCTDTLLLGWSESPDVVGSNWVYRNKDHGMISAVASVGLLSLWNVEQGLNWIDKYLYASEEYVKAGAYLGIGILCSGVRNESDPALALLSDCIEGPSTGYMMMTSICGLGLAYAGTNRDDILDLLAPIVANTEVGVDFSNVAFAALSLGLVFVGTCNDDVSMLILQRLMETSDTEFEQVNMARLLCLSLGLVFLGQGERVDVILEALKTITHKMCEYATITLRTCAYAGSGNVLKVQELLRVCSEHIVTATEPSTAGATSPTRPGAAGATSPTPVPPSDAPAAPVFNHHQAVAVIGIALIALGEELSTEMCLRTFEHLMHYSELNVKRAVPLAISLLYISNPDYVIVDQLARLSHDVDVELSQGAILGLGLVAAGTNNSRVAGLLRQLSEFYAKNPDHLFIVRLSQGLTAMSKGLAGLNLFHSDRLLLNKAGLGGLLALIHLCLDMKKTILDKYHFIMYYLALALNPRFCVALTQEDENTEVKPGKVDLHVGQAVETVGQAGRPKRITGFQTQSTPVLLGAKDRAELADSTNYSAVSSVIEGVVIVRKLKLVTEEEMKE